jgi:aspartyl-tRNA synthetase
MKKIEIIETIDKIGKEVEIFGWVNSIRKHGKIIFIDLRDRSGILQCVIDSNSKYFDIAENLKPEYVARIKGIIKKRDEKLINPNIETGNIELSIEELEILNEAETLPIPIDKDGYEINEELRLRYRYVDLKRKRLQKNLIKRNEAILFIRNWLNKRGFIEIETPILSKSTPEGARDYLVPSRIYKGKFYALPQSPQQYKQLLMVSGFEKYFQIARCFRDEDPRGDRQPEFTQLDIEMSFIEKDDILNLIEELMIDLVKNIFPEKIIESIPFPRLKYEDAIKEYNSDKPDLRKNKNNLAFCFIIDFPMFEWKENENRWDAVHHPFTHPKTKDGKKDFETLIKYLKEKPEELLSEQYDLVLNGFEIGGGSLRIYNPELLISVFETMGNKREKVIKNFNHLLTAFKYGVPPHGGIAIGLDRLLAVLLNEESIREVIAFPKTGEGRDPMMDIPSEVEKEQLDELGIKIKDECRGNN